MCRSSNPSFSHLDEQIAGSPLPVLQAGFGSALEEEGTVWPAH